MPFTKKQFLEVFKEYNLAVFPIQAIFVIAVLLCLWFLFKNYKSSSKIINTVLSFLWLWIGVVYHFIFFSPINKAAYFFSILFITQAIIFFYNGVIKDVLVYKIRKDSIGLIGWLFIIYALLIYPILGIIAGHGYPYQPTFGLPCPTTIFSFGILLFTNNKLKWPLVAIPFVWSLIGFTAALKFGIYEDVGLLISGIVVMLIFLLKKEKLH